MRGSAARRTPPVRAGSSDSLAQVLHLRAVPGDVTDADRDQVLAEGEDVVDVAGDRLVGAVRRHVLTRLLVARCSVAARCRCRCTSGETTDTCSCATR